MTNEEYEALKKRLAEQQKSVESAGKAYTERPAFSFDVNNDQLSQMYRDNFMRQGKQAMKETVAQVQSRSGGYGNSYAQQAGQQVQNQYARNFAELYPQLYSIAKSRYDEEGEKLAANYTVAAANMASTQQQLTDYETAIEEYKQKFAQNYIGLKGKISGEDGKTIIKNVKEMYKKSGDKMQAVANIEDYLNTLADSGYITAAEAADVIEEYRKKAGLYTQEEIKRQKRELSGEEEFVPEG